MSDRVRIRFPLEQDELGYPGVTDEFLWAEPLAEGLFRVGNIPFFALGVCLGDDVKARCDDDGILIYARLTIGHISLEDLDPA